MRLRVAARVGVLVALFLGLALAVVGAVQFARFEHGFLGLLKSRSGAVVQDLRQSVEVGLDLGLGLDALRNVQDLLDREKSRDGNILSIEAFDQTGSVVFSTDRTFIGDLIGERWLSQWRAAGNQSWFLEEDDALVVGVPLVNSFDAVIGGIALRYSRSFLDETLQATLFELVRTGIFVIIGAMAVSLGGTLLLFRPMVRDVDAIAAELDSVIGDKAFVPAEPLTSEPSTALAEAQGFAAHVRLAYGEIEKTSEEIRKLDELS